MSFAENLRQIREEKKYLPGEACRIAGCQQAGRIKMGTRHRVS